MLVKSLRNTEKKEERKREREKWATANRHCIAPSQGHPDASFKGCPSTCRFQVIQSKFRTFQLPKLATLSGNMKQKKKCTCKSWGPRSGRQLTICQALVRPPWWSLCSIFPPKTYLTMIKVLCWSVRMTKSQCVIHSKNHRLTLDLRTQHAPVIQRRQPPWSGLSVCFCWQVLSAIVNLAHGNPGQD